ncbi:MAG: hypothetical protein IIY05_06695 [Alistipes sp.]|nr:hypothetical protein [Alistipes sp.]
MGKFINRLKLLWLRIRRAISPVYIGLLCASFLLWYILKLQYTYTTNFSVLINVDGERLRVPCVVEGKGTNLLGYRVYDRKELKLPLSDLKYSEESDYGDNGELLGRWIVLDPHSVHNAISVRFSDIKVISVGDIPSIAIPEPMCEEIK